MRLLLMRVKKFFQFYTDPVSFVCGVIVGTLIITAFISANKEFPSFSWDAVGATGTILAAVIAVGTYRNSVKRQKKQDTIREFSIIRERYPNLSPKAHNPVPDNVRTEYLKEMERFCTGVNIGLYDIRVVDKMAGTMLYTQYTNYLESLIKERKEKTIQNGQADSVYREYADFIEQIQKWHKDVT